MSASTARTQDADPRYVVHGLLAEVHISLLAGDEEDLATFTLSMLASMETGSPFLGLPTTTNTAIYARDRMDRRFREIVGDSAAKRVTFVIEECPDRPSEVSLLVDRAILEATKVGARVLVFDLELPVRKGNCLDSDDTFFKKFRDAANRGFAVLLFSGANPTHGDNAGPNAVLVTGLVDHLILLEVSPRQEDYPFGYELRTVGLFAAALPGTVRLGLAGRGVWLETGLGGWQESPGGWA